MWATVHLFVLKINLGATVHSIRLSIFLLHFPHSLLPLTLLSLYLIFIQVRLIFPPSTRAFPLDLPSSPSLPPSLPTEFPLIILSPRQLNSYSMPIFYIISPAPSSPSLQFPNPPFSPSSLDNLPGAYFLPSSLFLLPSSFFLTLFSPTPPSLSTP